MTLRLFLLFTLFLMAWQAPAMADDADKALYAAAPPEGSAFVRLFNPGLAPLDAHVDSQSYKSIAPLTASAYKILPHGNVEIDIAGKDIDYTVEEGGFYTVIPQPGGNVTVLKDHPVTDITKAQVALYNLSSGPVSLKASAGSIDVVDATGPGQSAARAVNPLQVYFSIWDDQGVEQKALEPVVLERARVYNIFYTGEKAVVVRSETDSEL